MESFRQGLRASGFVDGQNVAIELRYARRGTQQLPELAAELIRLKVDVIYAGGDLAARVAQQATGTIPIVTITDDILGAGLIASLSRPGGNITGLTILAPELSAKRLEVLRDMIPGLSRVTALHDPTSGTSQVTMAESAARSLNLKLQVLEVRHRDDVLRAIRAARDWQAEALNVFFSPLLSSLHREIIAFAAEYRLPAIYQWKEHAEAGGLVSYGPSLAAMFRQSAIMVAKVLKGVKPADLPAEQPTLAARHKLPTVYFLRPFVTDGGLVSYGSDVADQARRAAGYVDRILRGEKPADLPVQAPTKYELVINLKTARALGLELPASVLARADEVIE
jgi:putative tryptophan/tyrosine transport system substrate-binding protein